MYAYPLRAAALGAAAILGLSACTTPYGYSGVSVGYGTGYYGGYGYSGYGTGYSPYWGWYDGFYYPGTGYYVYDRYRRPYRWTDRHRRYWTDRQRSYHRHVDQNDARELRQNWQDFHSERRSSDRSLPVGRSGDPRAPVARTVTQQQDRAVQREDRRTSRQERRELRRESREDQRDKRRDEREDRRD